MIQDLTVGDSGKVLLRYTIPMFISVAFQQIYNIADSMIAGKFAGKDALAAVGASYPITMIFMAVAVGCNIGCSVVISQLFGAKAYEKLKTAVYTTLFTGFLLSVFLMAVGLAATPAMMRLIRTPDNIFADGALYLRIYIGGFVPGRFQNAVVFSDRLFRRQYFAGFIVCCGVPLGCGRRGMGNVSCTGSGLCSGAFCFPAQAGRSKDGRKSAVLFHGSVEKNCARGRAEHFAAEFYFHRQYFYSGTRQFLRLRCDCRLFCGDKAEYFYHYGLNDAR